MQFFIITIAAIAVIIIISYIILKLFSRQIKEDVSTHIRDTFGALSREALSQNNEDFLKQATEKLSNERILTNKELEGKKELIDATLGQIKTELEKVQNLVTGIEKETEGKFSKVSIGLESQRDETVKLREIIGNLNKVLTPSQSRGRWGERMAEDILNLVGMKDGISYDRQTSLENSRNRPDFIFRLPQGKIVNMDVKFPFDNYRRYCEEENEPIRETLKNAFLKDARKRIKEVITRDYINTDANTLDYVIVFIPLEQAYAFIMEHDPNFIDDALKSKVIVCSPWSLYAYLSVIRQSIDNFNMERSAGRIMELMNDFKKQWQIYKDTITKIGDKIDSLQKEYDSFKTTRTNQLEKPLRLIEEITEQKELTSDGSGQSQN